MVFFPPWCTLWGVLPLWIQISSLENPTIYAGISKTAHVPPLGAVTCAEKRESAGPVPVAGVAFSNETQFGSPKQPVPGQFTQLHVQFKA